MSHVAQRVFFAAHVAEYSARIALIEPEHPGAAAHIEDWFAGCFSHNQPTLVAVRRAS